MEDRPVPNKTFLQYVAANRIFRIFLRKKSNQQNVNNKHEYD